MVQPTSGLFGQVLQRNFNNQARVEGPLAHLNDKELQEDVKEFSSHLPGVGYEKVLRAARVAKKSVTYNEVARRGGSTSAAQTNLLVTLDEHEKNGLVSEQDDLRRHLGQILPVVLTVGCAAFLQGHVQASINCASLFAKSFFHPSDAEWLWEWKLGAVNAMPFITTAAIGAPSALLLNYWMGRRGAITIRVAFGIAIGSVFNLAISKWNNALDATTLPEHRKQAMQQMLGAPARQTQLQALRDLYLLHKSTELDAYHVRETGNGIDMPEISVAGSPRQVEGASHIATGPELPLAIDGLTYANMLKSGLLHSLRQYRDLLTKRKLKNAMLSTCVVALAQQLCGINVFAFYSNTFFASNGSNYRQAMGYSAGFGAVNFVFGLLAMRRIDTWGRRKLMLTTLPMMSILLAAAALTFIHDYWKSHIPVLVILVYVLAVYSPSLGPIPFTLASESFPLAQRDAGCSVAIAVNLFFAGILTLCYPALDHATRSWGGLALFSGLNLVAFVLVLLLVEETKGFELEELSVVFAVPKRDFVLFQLRHIHYLWRRLALGRKDKEPKLYTKASPEYPNDGEGDDSDVSEL